MKVWVLKTGCRYEGASIIGIFSNESSGLVGAYLYMLKEIRLDAELYTDSDDTVITGYSPGEIENGYLWNEHYASVYTNKNGKRSFSGNSIEYVSLEWYELQ